MADDNIIKVEFDTHPTYDDFVDQWTRIRDCLEGQDKVKGKGTKYLPELSGQSTDEYKSYLLRATFFNLAARIVSANTGLIFNRNARIKAPKGLEHLNKDDETYTSLYELFSSTIEELLTVGRIGILVDIHKDLPIPVVFKTENILDWSFNDNKDLTELVLKEMIYDDNNEEVEIIYHLRLELIDNKVVYLVDEYRDDVFSKMVIPNLKGTTLDYIPFVCGSVKGLSFDIIRSPILDIVDLNYSHYRTSADYEHALHFVAMPTPVITGASVDKIKIGASAIVLPNENSKAFYLEFIGQGINALEKALDKKQAQMSTFSARIQDTSTKGSEAEGIVKLRYSSDNATLFDIAVMSELILSSICNTIADWMGISVDKSIVLDKDFIESKLSANELTSLTNALLKGAIDEETFIFNLRRGKMIDSDHKMKVSINTDTKIDNKNVIDNEGIVDKDKLTLKE